MTTVFVSYRQESDQNKARVRAFAEALRASGAGLDVVFDQFAQDEMFDGGGPDEGWPQWSTTQASGQDQKVLVIASEGWFRAYEGKLATGEGGLGAAVEAGAIRQRLYNSAGNNPHIRIVRLGGSSPTLPLDLQRYHVFDGDRDVATIVGWLNGGARGATQPQTPSASPFPTDPPGIAWPVADRGNVRDALAQLLTRDSQYRVVLIEGASEHGKSLITHQLLGNALNLPWLKCGRFDFKGTTGFREELTGFVRYLNVSLTGQQEMRLSERLDLVLASLQSASEPTLLIFDTFEDAGEAARWLEEALLMAVIRSPWLRIVIAGQRVPHSDVAPWAARVAPVIRLTALDWQDWFAYARMRGSDADEKFVREAFLRSKGKPTVLSQLLGAAL